MRRFNDDRATCTFYTKIGACRHGEKCSKRHIKPAFSNTIMLPNLYQNPKLNKNNDSEDLSPKKIQEYFDQVYKDVFIKLCSFGEIMAIVVCENENNHLNGNVYVRFSDKEEAYSAVLSLNQEWFDGRPVHCELSPVESFADANCRAHENNSCNRGDHCNFMHVRKPSPNLKSSLFKSQQKSLALKKLSELAPVSESHNDAAEPPAPETHTGSTQNDHTNPEISTSDNSQPVQDPIPSSTVTTSIVEKLFAI